MEVAAFPPAAAKKTYWVAIVCAIALIAILFYLFSGPASKEQALRSSPQPLRSGQAAPAPEGVTASAPNTAAAQDRPMITEIRILPSQPTKLDTLKAEIITGPEITDKKISYVYQWKINYKTVEGVTGDTLRPDGFKKRDVVVVKVTPYDGEKAGFALESPVVSIHSAPPTLELKTDSLQKKAGESFDMQLTASDPDGDAITFSLEAPLVEGMAIDKARGKISWRPRPDQRGKIRFGAGAEDADKTKTIKIFELTVQ